MLKVLAFKENFTITENTDFYLTLLKDESFKDYKTSQESNFLLKAALG